MPKAIAQKISLVSCADYQSVAFDRREDVAKYGVIATAYSLMRREVSCPKGSIVTIMSNNLSGDEMVELVKIAVKRDITIDSAVSLEGHHTDIIEALAANRYDLAQRRANLLYAMDMVELTRRDVARTEYWHARIAMEEHEGGSAILVALRDEVIFHGNAAGLTHDQIKADIAAIMKDRAAKIAA